MNDAKLFVLSDDIEFISLDSIPEQVKRNFDHDENDIVVTHQRTRKTSKVISKDFMMLLKEFKTPASWAEGILRYATQNKKDPQQVADEVFELLVEMRHQGYLIPYNKNNSSAQHNLFSVNDRFRQYVVKERLQVMEDSEVYLAEDESLNKYILKLFTAEDNDHIYENEITILKKLDGVVNPALLDEGTESGTRYFISEWFEGLSCETITEQYRNFNIRNNVVKVLDVCIAILHAYHHLHKQGIFHSDIHPKNILISAEGVVKVIDYGIAITKGGDTRMSRGGVCFYYEPELAIVALNGETLPPSSEKSEQYSIATLLYLLITGRHYLNFSLENEKLFRQISEQPPISFKAWDLNLPDELDEIFFIALSKDPAKRFSSLLDFANELKKIRGNIFLSHDFFVAKKENLAEHYIEFLIEKFGWDSSFIRKGLSLPATCSVNFGAAGIAYMYYRMACIREEVNLLCLADVWANRAGDFVSDYNKGFYVSESNIAPGDVGKRSIYHSPTGVYLVQAIISNGRGDMHGMNHAIENFFIAAGEPCGKSDTSRIDISFGKAGLLVGCSILFRELKATDKFNSKLLVVLANRLMDELWKTLDEFPEMNQPNTVNYYGIAHGWAGILYATLLWCHRADQNLPGAFKGRVEELLQCAIKNRNGLSWAIAQSEKKIMTGWCNGNAGHTFFWSLLYEHFKEEEFLSIAERSAHPIILDIQNTNCSLCCGIPGQVYALIRLYKLTGKNIYLKQAQKLVQRVLSNLSSTLSRNNSLFFGDVGMGVLLCESGKPEFAFMPLFE